MPPGCRRNYLLVFVLLIKNIKKTKSPAPTRHWFDYRARSADTALLIIHARRGRPVSCLILRAVVVIGTLVESLLVITLQSFLPDFFIPGILSLGFVGLYIP